MTGVHRTTLLRNHHYLALLVDFLERKPGAIATLEGDGLSPDLLHAKLRAAHGEIANLRHTVKVLTARIEALSSAHATSDSDKTESQHFSSPGSDLNSNLPFQDTAHLALILIDHINRAMNLPGGLQRIVVDLERKEIRDNSLRPGTQRIVGSERGHWLFEWANANRKFLFGS